MGLASWSGLSVPIQVVCVTLLIPYTNRYHLPLQFDTNYGRRGRAGKTGRDDNFLEDPTPPPSIETILGQKFSKIEIGRADESFACFAQRADMVDRKWNDVFPAVIVPDHFHGCAIGVAENPPALSTMNGLIG